MIQWDYKVTHHLVKELEKCVDASQKRTVIACDKTGGCMVHDVCTIGTDSLAAAFNALGSEGWELIMSTYHHGDLLCIWKRPLGKSSER